MQIIIKGKNVEITPALREYASKRLKKIEKYFDNIISLNIMLSTERARHIVEVTGNASGISLRGEEKTNDMYVSIDRVVEKLERQIKKQKAKYDQKNKAKTIRRQEEESMEERGWEEAQLKDLKVKSYALTKPMVVAEAIKEMESSGYNFFVFKNAQNNRVNIIYARKDGLVGLLDPRE